jgi:hypothetical protein
MVKTLMVAPAAMKKVTITTHTAEGITTNRSIVARTGILAVITRGMPLRTGGTKSTTVAMRAMDAARVMVIAPRVLVALKDIEAARVMVVKMKVMRAMVVKAKVISAARIIMVSPKAMDAARTIVIALKVMGVARVMVIAPKVMGAARIIVVAPRVMGVARVMEIAPKAMCAARTIVVAPKVMGIARVMVIAPKVIGATRTLVKATDAMRDMVVRELKNMEETVMAADQATTRVMVETTPLVWNDSTFMTTMKESIITANIGATQMIECENDQSKHLDATRPMDFLILDETALYSNLVIEYLVNLNLDGDVFSGTLFVDDQMDSKVQKS